MTTRRIVYFFSPGEAPKPQDISWSFNHVKGPVVNAVREERLKIPRSHLSADINQILLGLKDLHLRWVQPEPYHTQDPLSSRAAPGLHVFFTPQDNNGTSARRVCSLVNQLFGRVDCWAEDNFTELPADKVSYAPALQLYEPLERMPAAGRPLVEALCGSWRSEDCCRPFFESLETAAYFDLAWDHTESILKLFGFWPWAARSLQERSFEDGTTEMGLMQLGEMPGQSAYEIAPEGLLHKFGAQPDPSAAIFGIAARHRSHDGSFSASFLTPAGLHPILELKMSTRLPPPRHDHCKMYAYLTLPRSIFVDRYQLRDPLLLGSNHLAALRFASEPVDLEAPAYAVKTWGSAVLVELASEHKTRQHPEEEEQGGGGWEARIPLHLRYLKPDSAGYARIEVPYPAVFWACDLPESLQQWTSPFDSINLGYDTLFRQETSFWHLRPTPEGGHGRLFNQLRVPVLDLDKGAAWVSPITTLVIILGTLWVVWNLFSPWRGGAGRAAAAVGKGKGRSEKDQKPAEGASKSARSESTTDRKDKLTEKETESNGKDESEAEEEAEGAEADKGSQESIDASAAAAAAAAAESDQESEEEDIELEDQAEAGQDESEAENSKASSEFENLQRPSEIPMDDNGDKQLRRTSSRARLGQK